MRKVEFLRVLLGCKYTEFDHKDFHMAVKHPPSKTFETLKIKVFSIKSRNQRNSLPASEWKLSSQFSAFWYVLKVLLSLKYKNCLTLLLLIIFKQKEANLNLNKILHRTYSYELNLKKIKVPFWIKTFLCHLIDFF